MIFFPFKRVENIVGKGKNAKSFKSLIQSFKRHLTCLLARFVYAQVNLGECNRFILWLRLSLN